MSTIFRSVSQLRQISNKNEVTNGSLMEVSLKNAGGTYSSRAYPYSMLTSDMNDAISASMTKQYNLSAHSGQITQNNVVSNVDYILNGRADTGKSARKTEFCGLKKFRDEIPRLEAGLANLSNYDTVTEYTNAESTVLRLASVQKVKDMITKIGQYIGQNSTYTSYPFTSTEDRYAIDDSGRFYKMTFTGNGSKTTNEITILDNHGGSGNLVVWGWLADSGSVTPELAWVGLFGYIKNNWVPLQIQPWVVGKHSTVLQYVGFNVPVQVGLKLRVESGFPVNMLKQQALQSPGSLTFKTNQPCSFFGYTIGNA